jgi:hypothetical protein
MRRKPMDDFETTFEKEFPGVHIVGAKTVRRWDLLMIILSIAVCIVTIFTARLVYFKSIFIFVCICVIGAGALYYLIRSIIPNKSDRLIVEIDKDANWKQIVSYFTVEATNENDVYIIEERMNPYLVRIDKIDDEDDDE